MIFPFKTCDISFRDLPLLESLSARGWMLQDRKKMEASLAQCFVITLLFFPEKK